MVPVFDWQFPPMLDKVLEKTRVQHNARQHYFEHLWEAHEELSSHEVAQARCQFFDIPQTTSADYAEQKISLDLPDGGSTTGWAGIRFRNLDPRTPFVTVSLTQDPQLFLQAAPLRALQDVLQPRFAPFAPHGFTLRIPSISSPTSALPSQAPTSIPHQVWNTYWFTHLPALARSEENGTSGKPLPSLQLKPLKSLDDPGFDYARFHAQHQLWRLLHGDLAPWITPASAEELAESCQNQLCYLAYTPQQEPIGIIAGQSDNYYGIQGVSVLELLIYPTYQGKGYGKSMQQLFQQRLSAQGYTALWGSIYAENPASWHTARACGRVMVEQECFFPFDDLEP